MKAACIIPAGGSGTRFGGELPKQFLPLAGVSVLRRSILAAAAAPEIEAIVIAAPPAELERARAEAAGIARVSAVVAGGATRVASVANGLAALAAAPAVIVVHDAARPLARPEHFTAAIAAARAHGGAIVAVPIADTIKRAGADGAVKETVPRDALWRVQTPQAFRADLFAKAHDAAKAQGWDATDDAALVERVGGKVVFVEGDASNFKITTPDDLALAERLLGGGGAGDGAAPRIGFGRDKHPLVAGRPLLMGGVRIESELGPQGHSDGDALCHAIGDAILGAGAFGDLGAFFPDDRDETKGISGPSILADIRAVMEKAGYRVANVDATVWLRRPKLALHIAAMRERIAAALGAPLAAVSVKAKSGNGIDAVGRGEAVEAEAIVSLVRMR